MTTCERADSIAEALNRVHDPCSIAAGTPLGLIDMGLVQDWSLDEGNLTVTVCLTSPFCMMAPHIIDAAVEQLSLIRGVDSVDIEVDHTAVWTPDRMTDRGHAIRAHHSPDTRNARRLRPQAWRQRA